MKTISREEFFENLEFYKQEILLGKIFIYPTDTVYGLGCIATNETSITKIKQMKQRDFNKPLSIIVPSKDWIINNCVIYENHKTHFEELPGPYTFILNMKNINNISHNINPSLNSIGIRMPDNWFSAILTDLEILFVTTSVNISGESQLTSINDLNKQEFLEVDYFIDDGIINNRPSTIIDLREKEEKIIRS